jgi:hypothetical protein
MTKEILLTQGKVALVDDDDYDKIVPYNWCAHKERRRFYAIRYSPEPTGNCRYGHVRMHRSILYVPDGYEIDHINGNGLDNRKCNLRIVTRRENLQNLHIPKSSKYPGVCFDKPAGKWLARLRIGKQRKHIGHFKTEEEAALAYQNAVKELVS